LAPINQDINTYDIKEKERVEINEALGTSSLKLTRDTMEEHARAGEWFSSKWASKLFTSVKESFTSNFFSGGKELSQVKQSESMSDVTQNESPYPVDMELITALGNLWSIIFPQTIICATDCSPWKLFSSFCFSHASIATKLWLGCLMLNCKKKCITFELDTDMLHPGMLIGNTSTKSHIGLMISLAAVLRLLLVALDDQEFYTLGVCFLFYNNNILSCYN
jgi:hypothetical protein